MMKNRYTLLPIIFVILLTGCSFRGKESKKSVKKIAACDLTVKLSKAKAVASIEGSASDKSSARAVGDSVKDLNLVTILNDNSIESLLSFPDIPKEIRWPKVNGILETPDKSGLYIIFEYNPYWRIEKEITPEDLEAIENDDMKHFEDTYGSLPQYDYDETTETESYYIVEEHSLSNIIYVNNENKIYDVLDEENKIETFRDYWDPTDNKMHKCTDRFFVDKDNKLYYVINSTLNDRANNIIYCFDPSTQKNKKINIVENRPKVLYGISFSKDSEWLFANADFQDGNLNSSKLIAIPLSNPSNYMVVTENCIRSFMYDDINEYLYFSYNSKEQEVFSRVKKINDKFEKDGGKVYKNPDLSISRLQDDLFALDSASRVTSDWNEKVLKNGVFDAEKFLDIIFSECLIENEKIDFKLGAFKDIAGYEGLYTDKINEEAAEFLNTKERRELLLEYIDSVFWYNNTRNELNEFLTKTCFIKNSNDTAYPRETHKIAESLYFGEIEDLLKASDNTIYATIFENGNSHRLIKLNNEDNVITYEFINATKDIDIVSFDMIKNAFILINGYVNDKGYTCYDETHPLYKYDYLTDELIDLNINIPTGFKLISTSAVDSYIYVSLESSTGESITGKINYADLTFEKFEIEKKVTDIVDLEQDEN